MNIGVIGTGGVGGYYGGKLARLLNARKDLEVYFVARNEHLAEIRKNGLILSTAEEGDFLCRPTLATDNIGELPQLDLCLICVKAFDLPQVLGALKGKIGDDANIIPLLNGADVYERVRSVIKNGIVLPACCYLGTHIEKPGMVRQRGGNCTIFLGPDPKCPDPAPRDIFELFNSCNIRYAWRDDPFLEIWSKYIFISAYGLVTASEDKTIGEVLASPELCAKVIAIMDETVAIAKKRGINLPDSIVDDSFKMGGSFPCETKTSFQRDFERPDRPDERELYSETIVRLGSIVGIDTPAARSARDKLEKLKIKEPTCQ